MKPERGRLQAATQVKGLSAEKLINPEADTLIHRGRQQFSDREGKNGEFLAASETAAWNREDNLGTWEARSVVLKSGLRSNKP